MMQYKPIRSAINVVTGDSASLSSSTPTTTTTSIEKRPKRVACVRCRQSKLKCEGLDNGPPCIRCAKGSLACEVDHDYKRINKRAKLEDLSEQVKQLQSMVTQAKSGPNEERTSGIAQSTDNDADKQDVDAPVPAPETIPFPNVAQHQQSHARPQLFPRTDVTPSFQDSYDSPAISSQRLRGLSFHSYHANLTRQIDDFQLDHEQISSLFHVFFEDFHPFLPILKRDLSPDEYYDRSPLLFWTVIAIAARSYNEEYGIYVRLRTPLDRLLWEKIAVTPHSHLTIQAIVLLCLWPYSSPSLITNPSFMLISIARTACMHLGLHRPEILQDFNRVKFRVLPEHVEEAAKVWTGCFIVAESITSTEGQSPLFLSTDPTLSLACEESNMYHLPQHLRHQLVIQRFLNRVNGIMTVDANTRGTGSSAYQPGMLLASLEDDLHTLEKQLGGETSEIGQIWISSAALQLQSYYFLEPLNSPSRKEGLLRAYHTATTLINQMKTANEMEKFSHSAPRYLGQMLKLAALVIMKLLFSSYSRFLDISAGKETFNAAMVIQRAMSVENNDFPSRDCVVLTHLWSINQSNKEKRNEEPALRLNSRHSASVVHDSLWIWRNYYEERAINTEHLGRPPRVLPSLIQDSPVGIMGTPINQKLVDQYDTPQNANCEAGVASDQRNTLADTNLFNGTDGTSDNLFFQDNTMLDGVSDDPFDLMGAYSIPEAESGGMFYPNWMWDAGFSLPT